MSSFTANYGSEDGAGGFSTPCPDTEPPAPCDQPSINPRSSLQRPAFGGLSDPCTGCPKWNRQLPFAMLPFRVKDCALWNGMMAPASAPLSADEDDPHHDTPRERLSKWVR